MVDKPVEQVYQFQSDLFLLGGVASLLAVTLVLLLLLDWWVWSCSLL